jgi:hypothetical protein
MTATEHARPSGHTEERACPDWCHECEHDAGPEGAVWHKGELFAVDVYGEREGSVLVPLVVRPSTWTNCPKTEAVGATFPTWRHPSSGSKSRWTQ